MFPEEQSTNCRQRLAFRLAPLFLALLAVPLGAQPLLPTHVDDFSGHPRVIVISDIGNEPDDQMSLVRFLVYSNEFDVEALVATTSTWQKTATHPETMRKLIEAYGQVRPNLLLHAKGWPTAEDLMSKVFTGQLAYGMAATGADKASDGSKAIIQAVDKDDPRPIWITVWGGTNTLAQALIDVRSTRSPEELKKFVAKLRISSISDQDDAGPWIRRDPPTSSMPSCSPRPPTAASTITPPGPASAGDEYLPHRSGREFYSVVTNEWLETNIRSKGPLGKVYPRWMFIMEGDTPSYLGLIDNGLGSWHRPDWGGWGGRYIYRQPYGETHSIWTQGGDEFLRVTSQDTVTGIDGQEARYRTIAATVWRWR